MSAWEGTDKEGGFFLSLSLENQRESAVEKENPIFFFLLLVVYSFPCEATRIYYCVVVYAQHLQPPMPPPRNLLMCPPLIVESKRLIYI